jgi:hypothetical protein
VYCVDYFYAGGRRLVWAWDAGLLPKQVLECLLFSSGELFSADCLVIKIIFLEQKIKGMKRDARHVYLWQHSFMDLFYRERKQARF